jgi:hypothetical protein
VRLAKPVIYPKSVPGFVAKRAGNAVVFPRNEDFQPALAGVSVDNVRRQHGLTFVRHFDFAKKFGQLAKEVGAQRRGHTELQKKTKNGYIGTRMIRERRVLSVLRGIFAPIGML